MTSAPRPGRSTVLLFTWAAGSVDAITYLTAHVFTANMTGNTVLLGIAAGQARAEPVVSSLLALIAFVAGVVLGALASGEGDSASAAAAVRRAVWVETAILAFFALSAFAPPMLSNRTTVVLLIVSSGLAMGLQSAAVRRLKLPGIATTYITGTITSLFSGLVHRFQRKAGPQSDTVTLGLKRSMSLQAEVFLSYAVAAGICAALHTRWPSAVALMPVIALIGADVSLARQRS
jgi:uncharacterized membrane protein YoaK (UPF0700 family)